MLTAVLYFCVARKGESYGYRDGREAYKCVLGQMHHWHPWQQVQLWGIDLSYQLRPAVYGHEPHHHETVSVPAITYLPVSKFISRSLMHKCGTFSSVWFNDLGGMLLCI